MKMMKKLLLLSLFLLWLLAVAVDAGAQHDEEEAAAAAADPQTQTQVVQQNRIMRTRSLLQAPKKLDCPGTCLGRCGNNWKNEMCNKMCNVCCNRCNCVPPGTGQDTRHFCPCYDTMVNPHTGKLKCP